MNFLDRSIQKEIIQRLPDGKIIIIYGARQVGKTSLVQQILTNYDGKGRYLQCEHLPVQQALKGHDPSSLKAFFGDYDLLVFDEAQVIPDIGKVLKIVHDALPEIRIIATGSSSFSLADATSEALTGRAVHFALHPFSIAELKARFDLLELNSQLETRLRFGSYPGIVGLPDDKAQEQLLEIASSYLFKDVLALEGIKKSAAIKNLVQALALQIGSEVSYQELGTLIGLNRLTIIKYLDLLQKAFVIFPLHAFSRNKRKEISKNVKIYFCDVGIRNALIQNFNSMPLRVDVGALWENFCIAERMKLLSDQRRLANPYFWRTYSQKEVDYVEESAGSIAGYEFKWGRGRKTIAPKEFETEYNAAVTVISPENYWEFVLP